MNPYSDHNPQPSWTIPRSILSDIGRNMRLRDMRIEEQIEAARLNATVELERAKRLERKLAAQPAEPPEGSVVQFKRKFPNEAKHYSYSAIRIKDHWYLSGKIQTRALGWSDLVEFANVGKIRVATGFRKLHPRGEA